MTTIESTRNLASVVKVEQIDRIEGADRIVLATVKGWKCVTKIEDFQQGDLGVYFEIDSVVDRDDPTFLFLKGRYRIKTMKIRGVISQGLLLPISCVESKGIDLSELKEGMDLTQLMNVKKFVHTEEMSLYCGLSSTQKNPFPAFCPKTDEERLQNNRNFLSEIANRQIVITRKEDGCSATYSFYNGSFGIHSRNTTLEEQDSDNVRYFHIENKFNIKQKMIEFGKNIAIQGEIVGPKINCNRLQMSNYDFRVFNIYDIDTQTYLSWQNVLEICSELSLNVVPVIFEGNASDLVLTLNYFLKLASEQTYIPSVPAEGIVVKTTDGKPRISFKVISNEYLLKHDL